MTSDGLPAPLLVKAVEFLLEREVPIARVGDASEQPQEIGWHPVTECQIVLRAYALGMAEATAE